MLAPVNRYPINGTFELTGRCNLQCKMCFVRVNQKTIDASCEKERNASEWIGLAKEVADSGTLRLLLTGGEITLRPDFPEIYEAIAKMGFVLTIYTNATLISDELLHLFERYPPHTIGVTVYGASNETYKKLCGDGRGFDRFCDGVSKLKSLPSLIDVRTTLVKDNFQDYLGMKEYTEREFGKNKKLHVTSRIFPAVRGANTRPEDVRLSEVTMFKFLNYGLIQAGEDIKSGVLDSHVLFSTDSYKSFIEQLKRHRPICGEEYLFSGCGAGISSYFVSWSGNMYACGALPIGFTKPFEKGFAEAWEQLPLQYPVSHLNDKCKSCDKLIYCDSCPAYRILETGEWDGVPQGACKVASLNKQLIRDLQPKEKDSK